MSPAESGKHRTFLEEEMAAEKKECSHPPCTCMVSSGKYCSVECEAMEETPDLSCDCNHPECKGRVD